MKKFAQSLFVFVTIVLSTSAVDAQSVPKILVVDMVKLFNNHYKTQEQQAKFKVDEANAKDQLDRIEKEGNALIDQYKELDDQSKNPTATSEAKAKAQAEAQKKMDEIRQKQGEQQSFVQNTRNSIQQRGQTFKTVLLEEITKVAVDIAMKKGATFLLDKSGPTMLGVSSVLYSDPTLDITDEVMAVINKDRPAVTPTVTSASGTGFSPAEDAPKITVPVVAPTK